MALKAALAIAGTVVSAASAIAQGNAQNAMAKYNAKLAERDAEARRRQASMDEELSRSRSSAIMSRQRAVMAAAGVDTSSGTPLAIAEQSAEDAEMDALAIRYGGAIGAQRFQEEANLSRMQGRSAKQAGMFRAGSTLLTGFGSTPFNFGTTSTVPGGNLGRIGYSSGQVGGRGMMVGGV